MWAYFGIGGAVLGLGYLLFGGKHKYKKFVPPHPGPAKHDDVYPPPPGIVPLVQKVHDIGKAKQSATDLYTYLKAHSFDGSQILKQMITTFQQISNSDKDAYQLTGPL